MAKCEPHSEGGIHVRPAHGRERLDQGGDDEPHAQRVQHECACVIPVSHAQCDPRLDGHEAKRTHNLHEPKIRTIK